MSAWVFRVAKALAFLLVFVLGVSSCATTQAARRAKESGFLEDYSRLEPVKEGGALELYENPEVDFASYDKLLVEDVEIWCCEVDSKLKDVPAPELRRLSLTFFETLRKRLGRDYELVEEPGHGVLRLEAALTEARKSVVPLDIFTTIYPSGRILSAVKKLATGTEAFVGSASFEVRLTDSETGTVLMEEADRRAGGKSIEKWSRDPWHDVELIFEYWAEQLAGVLRERRSQARTDPRGQIGRLSARN